MNSLKKYDRHLFEIIKNFLLCVFVVMCITALAVSVELAKNNTQRKIDGSEASMITREEILSFIYSFGENLYG